MTEPDLEAVRTAARRIAGTATRTPLKPSPTLGGLVGGEVFLKLETTQPTGSFKIRGAANALLRRHRTGELRGAVTASTGNHATAVTHVAHSLGVEAIVCLAKNVSPDRAQDLRSRNATVLTTAEDQTAAIRQAAVISDERGYAFVPPFDDPDVISGQGTIATELYEDLPRIDTVLVPVSGGGLAAGIGLALKSLRPAVRVVGLSAERAPAMKRSLDAGRPVPTDEEETLAESLNGDLGPDNRFSFPLVRRHVDDIVLIGEDEIQEGMRWALREEKLLVEGASAVTFAYLLRKENHFRDSVTAAIITGDRLPRSRLTRLAECL